MKLRFLFVFVLLLVSTLMYAQDTNALDSKYGFGSTKLERTLDSFDNLVLFDADFNGYWVINPKLTLGTSILQDIAYYFYNTKLYNISIRVAPGYVNQYDVLRVLESAYGASTTEYSNGISTHTWHGNKVTMTYERFINCDQCTAELNIYCNYLYEQYLYEFTKQLELNEKACIQQGKQDL